MSFKDHAKHEMALSRRMIENILSSFESEDDWFYQPTPAANHALWIIGHLGLADNLFASKFREATANKPEGWDDLFWFGSEPTNDRTRYPAVDEVLGYFRERRANLLRVLDEVTEKELDAPAPGPNERGPLAGAPNMGHAFQFVSFHEATHLGQLTVCHRGLGHQPVYQPEKVSAGEDA